MKRKNHLFQLINAHAREIMREPAVLFWGIGFPILMALGLGIAFTQKGDLARTVAVVEGMSQSDVSKTSSPLWKFLKNQASPVHHDEHKSKEYQFTLQNDKTGNTTYKFISTNWNDAIILLKRGHVNVILDEENGQVRYHFDPLNPEAHLSYLQLSRILAMENPGKSRTHHQVEPLTLPGSRYIDFLIPGLIAMGIMMSSMWGISYGLIEKRKQKLLRRMIATPMKKSNFLISLITVRILMNLVEALLLFLFAYYFFSISISGSILGLLLVFLAGNVAFSGIAIFTSSRTANTEIGNGLINAIVLPMMVLSGIFFSYHNFPDWSIPYIRKLPLTVLADSLRSIFIEGSNLPDNFMATLLMTGIGVFFFGIGLKIFKWY